jgi:hypothetical protein
MILSVIVSLLIIIFIFIVNRNTVYSFVKKILHRNEILKKIVLDLSKIKAVIKSNVLYFLIIFLLFLMQAILECIVFSQIFQIYTYDIDFEISSFLWMTTSLVTSLSVMNFFGFFEIIFAYSSTFFDEKFTNIVIMVFGYRLMNILSQFILIISSYLYKRLNQ